MSSSERLESREDDAPPPPPESDWVRTENNEAAWSNYAGETGGEERTGAVLEGSSLGTPETFPEFDPGLRSDQGSDSTQTDIEPTQLSSRGEAAAVSEPELRAELNRPVTQSGDVALDSTAGPVETTEVIKAGGGDTVVDASESAITEAEARDNVQAALQEPSDQPLDTVEPSDFRDRVAQSEAHEALSLKEAEDYARDDLGIEQVDYSDFDQRTANEVNATLEVLRDKYPETGGIEYLGSTQGRNEAMRSEDPDLAELRSSETRDPDSNEVAVTLRETPGYNGISMNRDWSGDYDKANRAVRKDERDGGSAEGTGSISGVIAHEYGHVVENHLRAMGQFDDIAAEVQETFDFGPLLVSSEVSAYARKSKQELFAEAFAEYQMKDHPRPFAERLGKLVDEKFKR
jgi:hypothetical protein